MKVNECIFFQLASTTRNGINFWTKKLESLNLTVPQATTLNFLEEIQSASIDTLNQLSQSYLGDGNGVSFHALSKQLNMTSPTLTGIVDRLEKNGMVERSPNPQDRRSILISLTEKGLGIVPEIRKAVTEANQLFLNALSKEEELMLRRLLNRLREP